MAPAAFGAFTADLYFGDAGGAAITDVSTDQATLDLIVWADVNYDGRGISYINLNFSASDDPLNVAGAGWTWDPVIVAGLNFQTDDLLNPDKMVTRIAAGSTITPGTPVRIGEISLNLPAWTGVDDVHVVALGAAAGNDSTAIADGINPAALTHSDTTITIIPEPATLALLGLGAVATLLRRRR